MQLIWISLRLNILPSKDFYLGISQSVENIVKMFFYALSFIKFVKMAGSLTLTDFKLF